MRNDPYLKKEKLNEAMRKNLRRRKRQIKHNKLNKKN